MRNALEARGFSEAAVASRLGVKRNTFNHWLNDRAEPKFEVLLNFCEITGVEIGDILRRGDDDHINFKLDESDPDFVRIDILDVDLAAGAGRIAPNEEAVGQLAFRADWLNRIGVNPAEASLVRVEGESMEPTLESGSMVMIDHRNKEPIAKRGVFACRLGDLLVVKRVEVSIEDRSVMLHSDNPAVPTRHIPSPDEADFEIIGKVVWSAKTWAD